MNTRISWAASATAALLLLSGCATTVSGSAHAGSPLPSTASAAATDTMPAEDPAPEESSEPAETQKSAQSSAPVALETEPLETESLETESLETGDAEPPAGDSPLDADSEAWLGTFCNGLSDVIEASQFDATGMSNDEVLNTLFHTYAFMSTTADSTSFQLDKLPPPTFAGAATIAPALQGWLAAVTSAYGDGANIFAEYEFSTAEDLEATIDGIESAMDGPNADLNTALANIDPSVKAAVQAMPECAFLSTL